MGGSPVFRATIVTAGLILQACIPPWAWAERTGVPVTLAVLEFSLNLDISNPGDSDNDRLPGQLAGENLRRLASTNSHYELAEYEGGDAGVPCSDTDCALEKGRQQGVERVIWGQITKVSALIWFVSAHLVEVSTGTTLHAETLQFRGNMTDVIPRLTQILWRRMHEGK